MIPTPQLAEYLKEFIDAYYSQYGSIRWKNDLLYRKGSLIHFDESIYIAQLDTQGENPELTPDKWLNLLEIISREYQLKDYVKEDVFLENLMDKTGLLKIDGENISFIDNYPSKDTISYNTLSFLSTNNLGRVIFSNRIDESLNYPYGIYSFDLPQGQDGGRVSAGTQVFFNNVIDTYKDDYFALTNNVLTIYSQGKYLINGNYSTNLNNISGTASLTNNFNSNIIPIDSNGFASFSEIIEVTSNQLPFYIRNYLWNSGGYIYSNGIGKAKNLGGNERYSTVKITKLPDDFVGDNAFVSKIMDAEPTAVELLGQKLQAFLEKPDVFTGTWAEVERTFNKYLKMNISGNYTFNISDFENIDFNLENPDMFVGKVINSLKDKTYIPRGIIKMVKGNTNAPNISTTALEINIPIDFNLPPEYDEFFVIKTDVDTTNWSMYSYVQKGMYSELLTPALGHKITGNIRNKNLMEIRYVPASLGNDIDRLYTQYKYLPETKLRESYTGGLFSDNSFMKETGLFIAKEDEYKYMYENFDPFKFIL